MAFAQNIKALHANKQYPRFSRQIVLPGIGTGIGAELTATATACTYGVWEDIAATTDILTDTLIVGILLDTPVAAGIYTVDIGLTHILRPVPLDYADATAVKTAVTNLVITNAEVHRAEVRIAVQTAAGAIEPVMLTFPIYVLNGVGVLGRVKTNSGDADTINASVLCLQNFE